ncbi:hypothetical protein GCM10029963_30810 [Micromonospora andamanensis]
MLDTLDAAAVRRWCAGGLAALKRHQGEIDELNVYPVPDGDTGTNLVLTLTSAQQALAMDLDTHADGVSTAHGHALRLMARGALLGARGNSGVILSQILRGLADALAAAPQVRGRELAVALREATDAAYTAVARPVEGTVLSVVSAAAGAAEQAGSDELRVVARAAANAATAALARTPEQLPALARAGVVDAGGRGLCLLLDALVEVVTGRAPNGRSPACLRCGSRSPSPGRPDRRSTPTRCSSCSTPSPRRWSGCGRRWPPSATPWWSSATPAPGRSTCTSTTSARRSRRVWPPAARTRSR